MAQYSPTTGWGEVGPEATLTGTVQSVITNTPTDIYVGQRMSGAGTPDYRYVMHWDGSAWTDLNSAQLRVMCIPSTIPTLMIN